MLTVKEISSSAGRDRFIRFPNDLYKNHPLYVPPLFFDERNTLDCRKNPAFEYCEARYWMAFRGERAVGRVAAILNRRYAEKWGRKLLRFGWIDFIDDPAVCAALISAVEGWAKELGCEGVHGPLGFCDMDREGLLIEGFDQEPTMITIYNHPYYPVHLEALGYRKDVDWDEYSLKAPKEVPERIVRLAEVVKKRLCLTVLPAKRTKDLRPYARDVFHLVNEAYAHLYGTVELTGRQIDAYTEQYFGFLDTRFTKIVLDRDGRLAAFGISMASLTAALRKARGRLFPFGFLHILKAMRHPKRIELLLIAVRKDLQAKGVNAILIHEVAKSCAENGITDADTNPELETNRMVQDQWKSFAAVKNKRRRCYIKTF